MSLVLANGLTVVVALLHAYFLALEMFMWRGRARVIFKKTEKFADETAVRLLLLCCRRVLTLT